MLSSREMLAVYGQWYGPVLMKKASRDQAGFSWSNGPELDGHCVFVKESLR